MTCPRRVLTWLSVDLGHNLQEIHRRKAGYARFGRATLFCDTCGAQFDNTGRMLFPLVPGGGVASCDAICDYLENQHRERIIREIIQ